MKFNTDGFNERTNYIHNSNGLNKVKNNYMILYKELQKNEKQKQKEPSTFDVILSIIKCILFIIFIPVLFFIMLFYYLLK